MKNLRKSKIVLAVFIIFAILLSNIAYAEESDKMSIEIGSVEIADDAEEASVNLAIKNAEDLSGATLQINYDERLEYVGFEKDYDNYYIEVVENADEHYITIAFISISEEAIEGDINIGTIKFKISDKTGDSSYSIKFGDETELISSESAITYDIVNGSITYQTSKTDYTKFIILAVGVIVILLLIVLLVKIGKKGKKDKE